MASRNIAYQPRIGFNVPHMTAEGMVLWIPEVSNVFADSQFVRNGIVDPFATSTTQEYALGSELWYHERRFRYALNGGVALTVGKLVQSVVPLAGHIDEAINEPAVGATEIAFTPNTVTTDDLAANALADGYIYINDDTGEGYMYRIKSHPAITGGTSGVITLFDPIVVAPGASATATVLHNSLRNVIVHPSPNTAPVQGVTVSAVAADSYCWLAVRGPTPVLIDGTVVIGEVVVPSSNTDGAVMASAAFETDGPIVGDVIAVNATTEYGAIRLWLP